MQTKIPIKGMSCQHCVKAVDWALRSLEDIEVVEVMMGQATISSAQPPNMPRIRAAIEEQGFELG